MKVKNENLEKLFMYKIVDDFLPSLLFKYYSDHVSHLNFPWFYTNNISTGNKSFLPDVPILNNFGFSSPAFADIDNPPAADGEATIFLFYPLLLMVQEECDGTEILRARFDMTTHTHSPHEHTAHVDTRIPNWACILYLNETDGDTVLYNEKGENGKVPKGIDLTIKKVISPKPNRLLIFDGDLIHTGYSPVEYSNRILLNMNFKKK